MNTQLDVVAIGRVSVDLYGQQIGSRLEDIATFVKGVGGCPANVAIGAARLGLKAALISRVGDEPMGRFVREQLAREGVDTRGVRTDPRRLTSLVLLSVFDEKSFPLLFYRDNCADSALCEEDVEETLVGAARAVLVTGTHFSLPAAASAQRKAIDLAKAHGARVVLDIDYRPNLWGIGGHDAGESRYARSAKATSALGAVLPDCDLIVGTEEELHIAAGVEDTLEAIRRIRSMSAAVILCKRGAGGCVVFPGSIPASLERGLVVPAEPVEVYNVLGAGDAFLAGFLRGYLRNLPHELSARQANACGAIAVSRLLCSAEFPTVSELDHYLVRGSVHAALRKDPDLNHLHWATTRKAAPSCLCIVEIDLVHIREEIHDPPGACPGAEDGRLTELRRLVIEALGQVAAGSEGCGVLIRATHGSAVLREALRRGLWVAGAVHRPGSRPLEFEPAGSLGSRLLEWPTAIAAACRCRYQSEDAPELRAVQERQLLRVASACRAQGRELLLGVETGEISQFPGATACALTRLYEIGIRPDWWELEPQASPHAWEQCAEVIARNDEHCHGILVGLGAWPEQEQVQAQEPEQSQALAGARGPWVRGVTVGDSIFSAAAEPWLAGRASTAATVADMADRFRALLAVWSAGRGQAARVR